jgi:4-hydroxy-2-oxoheptanedioate aldolase
MSAPENLTKSALARGQMQIGAWLGLASPVAAEIAAGAGYDWVLIDAEHGANTLADVQAQVQAVAGRCPVAARVAAGEAWMLKQVLDLGVQTVVVPMVDTGAEAAAMARAVRYPPQGSRGLASALVRASGYGAIPDYAASANDQICLMVQAESRAAVENIDAIALTEAVDGVFIGPSDLAADLGHLGNPGAPEVVAAIGHIVARTRAAGKVAGIFCLDPAKLAPYRDQGVTFIAVASDIAALAEGLRDRAAEAKRLVE